MHGERKKLTITRVSVVLYPSVLTTVGKNELNPQAAYQVSNALIPLVESNYHMERLEQNKECEPGIGERLLETSDSASTLL